MEIDEFIKLEEKVHNLVKTLKLLKDENNRLKLELEKFKKESSLFDGERSEIKQKITALIELIDSINK